MDKLGGEKKKNKRIKERKKEPPHKGGVILQPLSHCRSLQAARNNRDYQLITQR